MQERERTSGAGLVSIPTANHDFQRPACGSRNTDDQLKALMLFNLTFSDLPVIYYGDEIGLKYLEGMPNKEGSRVFGRFNRAGSRTPMQWSKEKNAGFSLAESESLYLPIDTYPNFPNVESQEKNENSLLNFSRKVVEIKKSTDVFTYHGKLKILNGANSNEYPLVYLRESKQDKFLVVVNPSAKNQTCPVNLPLLPPILKIGKGVSIQKNIIDCEPVSYAIFKLG